jgi:hypothetical protein
MGQTLKKNKILKKNADNKEGKKGNLKNNKGMRNRKRYVRQMQTDKLQGKSRTQKRTKYNKKKEK